MSYFDWPLRGLCLCPEALTIELPYGHQITLVGMNTLLVVAGATAGERMKGPPIEVLMIVAGWVLFQIIGQLFIWRASNAEKKHRRYRCLIFANGGIFFLLATAFVVAAGMPLFVLLIVAPWILLIGWTNVRFTTFCDGCNRRIYNRYWWRRIRSCPFCRTELSRPA